MSSQARPSAWRRLISETMPEASASALRKRTISTGSPPGLRVNSVLPRREGSCAMTVLAAPRMWPFERDAGCGGELGVACGVALAGTVCVSGAGEQRVRPLRHLAKQALDRLHRSGSHAAPGRGIERVRAYALDCRHTQRVDRRLGD